MILHLSPAPLLIQNPVPALLRPDSEIPAAAGGIFRMLQKNVQLAGFGGLVYSAAQQNPVRFQAFPSDDGTLGFYGIIDVLYRIVKPYFHFAAKEGRVLFVQGERNAPVVDIFIFHIVALLIAQVCRRSRQIQLHANVVSSLGGVGMKAQNVFRLNLIINFPFKFDFPQIYIRPADPLSGIGVDVEKVNHYVNPSSIGATAAKKRTSIPRFAKFIAVSTATFCKPPFICA